MSTAEPQNKSGPAPGPHDQRSFVPRPPSEMREPNFRPPCVSPRILSQSELGAKRFCADQSSTITEPAPPLPPSQPIWAYATFPAQTILHAMSASIARHQFQVS